LNKSRILAILLLFSINDWCISQGSLQSSLYMLDIYQHNPAYAGFDRSISANFNYRTQWTGVLENPIHLNANVHLPVYLLNGGVGMSITNESAGALSFTKVNLSYNRVESFQGGIISGGLSLGFKQLGVNGDLIRTPLGSYDGTFSHEDPILGETKFNGITPDWVLGIFARTDYFDFGLTIENLFFSQASIENINFQNSKIISLYGGIPFFINELEIQPSLHIKTNLQQIQTDLSVIVKSGNIFGGLGLRGFNENSFDALSFFGGIKLNDHYTLSYAYDFILSELSTFSQGTHEININYNLNKLIGIGLPPEIIYDPRHF